MMAPQKRTAEEAESLLVDVRAIIVGTEGTTMPISFPEDTLIPTIRKNIKGFLTKNFENADVQKSITALRDQVTKDKEENVDGVKEIPSGDATKDDVVSAVVDYVTLLLDGKRNTTALNTIQELIWKDAFEANEIKGALFEDVSPMLKMLADEGFHLYVYSNCSIESQKLLFANSTYGDLTEVFSAYFDPTTAGSKTESASYKKIATEIKNEPKEILFLTHLPQEAEAAVAAGLRCALIMRQGNAELTDEHLQKFACIERFDELYGDEDEDEDIKRFAGDNGEPDDDDDEEGEDDDEEGEGEDGDGDDA